MFCKVSCSFIEYDEILFLIENTFSLICQNAKPNFTFFLNYFHSLQYILKKI